MKVVRKPSDQQFWVVRAQSGIYVPNFENGKQIAIGHIDHLRTEETKSFFPDKDTLFKSISDHVDTNKKRSKAQIHNHYNQVIRFIYDIKIGDWVVCPTITDIRIGRVTGKPYISRKVVEVVTDIDTGASVKMRSNLRRDVAWGPKISRASLPYKLNQALRANQAVFSLNEHWEFLYHAVYPCFFDDKAFHFSIKINQKNRIDNYSVSQLLGFLSEAEAAAMLYKKVNIGNEPEFVANFNFLRKQGKLNLSTKAQFMSPGDILGSVSVEDIKTITENAAVTAKSAAQVVGLLGGYSVFYMIFSSIFGSSKIGWDGLIDKDRKNKYIDGIEAFIRERWTNKGGESAQEALKLSLPKYDTLALEDHSKDSAKQRQHVTYVDLDQIFNKSSSE